jgi:hypothetical protein
MSVASRLALAGDGTAAPADEAERQMIERQAKVIDAKPIGD